jgi:hypothetical protein
MNQIHDAVRISLFLNLREEGVEDKDEDIFADIIPAHSVEDSPEGTE